MLRSEMYREAAKAVIISPQLNADEKIEVLKVLFRDESVELLLEEREAKADV